MNWQITLTWNEANCLKTQTIESSQYSESSGGFRIGRDRSQCHLVLSDTTVSRLHVELFFKPEYQRFYLRSLQPKNPPKIDGGSLISGEVALTVGSTIELGNLHLSVSQISEVPSPAVLPITSLPSFQPVSPQLLRSPISSPAHYRLECPHCHTFAPLHMRNCACHHCGHFLADAESILIPPSR